MQPTTQHNGSPLWTPVLGLCLLLGPTGSHQVVSLPPAASDAQLAVRAYRPVASTWKRTKCGHPGRAAVPAGSLGRGVDYGGGDGPPCGIPGCLMPRNATLLDCELTCSTTSGCVAYVYAAGDCAGHAGQPVCWTKHKVTMPSNGTCRVSQVLAQPAVDSTDIPSKWAAEVSGDRQPLPLYPRPQMVRAGLSVLHGGGMNVSTLRNDGDAPQWANLNGLWEWEPASATGSSPDPPFGRTLNGSILVPFPVESCLSGVAPTTSAGVVQKMWYRLVFDAMRAGLTTGRVLLHFGAVDWQSTIFLNGKILGNHTGGYDGFEFDITERLVPSRNELILHVFDPSDRGTQPNGKQRISAIDSPGGDTYTPSSGIWQTVWLEAVPTTFVSAIHIDQASRTSLTVAADVHSAGKDIDTSTLKVRYDVMSNNAGGKSMVVAFGDGEPGVDVSLAIPDVRLWHPSDPFLYDVRVSLMHYQQPRSRLDDRRGATEVVPIDSVLGYFGLRTFALGPGIPGKGMRPLLNGNYTFIAGVLDQSWWPDGLYTAPTDAALAFDIQTVPTFGLNAIRLHQKVNPERWYYHADRLGVIVLQDMVQKYGGATNATIPLFVSDLAAMLTGPRSNHPCIVQWETFNEGDCWQAFMTAAPYDPPGIVALAQRLQPKRLIDAESGANMGWPYQHLGDVHDYHSYNFPLPSDAQPLPAQYCMLGEFGGMKFGIPGREWKPNACMTQPNMTTTADMADAYITMVRELHTRVDHLSAAVYTQTTDLELECDGLLNYDRSSKLSASEVASIRKANEQLVALATAS